MCEIGFGAMIAYAIIALIVGIMSAEHLDKEIIYATMGVGYGGLAVGFLIASLRWLFMMV